MRIAPLIRESFLRPRLKQAGALVVYDPEQRRTHRTYTGAWTHPQITASWKNSTDCGSAALWRCTELRTPSSRRATARQ
mgnify:CR=1 FL=1